MNSLRFYFLKNKEIVLYITCFLTHAGFAPVFNYYGFSNLFIYNTVMAFVYAILILLIENKHHNIFLTFAFLEIIVNAVFVTVQTGTDFGSMLFTMVEIPCLFFYVYSSSSHKSKSFNLFLSILAAAATLFIIWWEFGRPRALFSGYLTAVTMYKGFYRIKVIYSSIVSLFFLIYLSLLTEKDLYRSAEKNRRHAQELDFMANHDQLTGLMNRRKITAIINKLQVLKDYDGADYAVSIFDIDNFKSVNDTYGHDAGDFILQQVTALVKEMLGPDTEMARWGGEEFLIVFKYCDGFILSHLEKIRMTIQQTPFIWNGTSIPITLTFGVSSSKNTNNPDKILIAADNRLYYGKTHGKNQICVAENVGELS